MARFVVGGAFVVVAVFGGMPGVGAQTLPLDQATDLVDDTVDQIEDTVDQVDDAVEGAGGAVDQSVGDAVETVEQTAGSTSAAVGHGSSAASGGAGAVSGTLFEADGAASADAGGSSPGGEPGKRRGGRAGTDRSTSHRLGADGGSRMARVVSPTEPAPLVPLAYVPLIVRLTNDADGDGTYAEAESAPRPRADIPFQLQLENAGPHELTILAIRDASGPSEEGVCGELVGTRLATNQSAVCRFSVEGLSPTEGERLVAVVEVDAAETADPSTTGTVTDTSVIRTEDVGVLGEVVRGVLGTLATTGAWIGILAAVAVGLAAAGVWMIRSGNQQRESSPTWVRPRTQAGVPAARGRTEGDVGSQQPRSGSRHTIGLSLIGHSTVRREGLTAGTTRRGG